MLCGSNAANLTWDPIWCERSWCWFHLMGWYISWVYVLHMSQQVQRLGNTCKILVTPMASHPCWAWLPCLMSLHQWISSIFGCFIHHDVRITLFADVEKINWNKLRASVTILCFRHCSRFVRPVWTVDYACRFSCRDFDSVKFSSVGILDYKTLVCILITKLKRSYQVFVDTGALATWCSSHTALHKFVWIQKNIYCTTLTFKNINRTRLIAVHVCCTPRTCILLQQSETDSAGCDLARIWMMQHVGTSEVVFTAIKATLGPVCNQRTAVCNSMILIIFLIWQPARSVCSTSASFASDLQYFWKSIATCTSM